MLINYLPFVLMPEDERDSIPAISTSISHIQLLHVIWGSSSSLKPCASDKRKMTYRTPEGVSNSYTDLRGPTHRSARALRCPCLRGGANNLRQVELALSICSSKVRSTTWFALLPNIGNLTTFAYTILPTVSPRCITVSCFGSLFAAFPWGCGSWRILS